MPVNEALTKDIVKANLFTDYSAIQSFVENGDCLASDYVKGYSLLHLVCTKVRPVNIDNALQLLKFLILKGANVNAKSQDGWSFSPLHTAARKGLPELVEFLIDNGANKLAEESKGNTALDYVDNMIAIKKNDSDMLRRFQQIKDLLESSPLIESQKYCTSM